MRALLGRVALACVLARVGSAQVPVRRALRVQVSDSAGAPVSGTNLVVLTAFRDTLGRGTTGDDGRALILVDSGNGERRLVVRRIGFLRADRVFRFSGPGQRHSS